MVATIYKGKIIPDKLTIICAFHANKGIHYRNEFTKKCKMYPKPKYRGFTLVFSFITVVILRQTVSCLYCDIKDGFSCYDD